MINYSIKQLEDDYKNREVIREQLISIKSLYKIENKKILDIGCGDGANLMLFTSSHKIGVDGLRELESTLLKKNIQFVCRNLNDPGDLNLNDVDCVLCLDVIEHLENPLPILNAIHDVMNKKSIFIVNMPNQLDLIGRIKILFGSSMDNKDFFPDYAEWNNPHIRFYTRSGAIALFNATGFKIIDDRSYKLPSFPLINKLRRIIPLGLFSLLSKINPSLFSGGHFFVMIKR